MEYRTLKVEFELNTKNEYEITKIEDGKFSTLNDTSLICFGLWEIQNAKVDTTFYVNDLNKFYIYLIKYLLNQCYECKDKLTNKSFSYVYKSGTCPNVKVQNSNGIKIFFINFECKFGIEFGSDKENEELIKYALSKNRLRNSLGADSYNEFIATIFNPNKYKDYIAHQIMRTNEHFPIFEYSNELLEAKEHVSGFQMCLNGDYKNLIEYDLESSYPSQLLCNTPCGLPKIYTNIEDIPTTYFKVITFTYFNCKLKPNKIEFLCAGIMGQLTLTERMFELFKENYDVCIIIKQITAFKTQKSPFRKFIMDNIINGKKNEKRKHIAKYNKYIGNSIIGYMGRNTITTQTTAKFNELGIETTSVDKIIDPIYLPVYLCVLDRAKSMFIRTIQNNIDCIVYANTDGFLSTKPLNLDLLNIQNSLPIGNYREKNTYSKIYIECINGYAGITSTGEIDNTISGMTLEGLIEPEQYRNREFDYYINVITPHGTIQKQKISPHQ